MNRRIVWTLFLILALALAGCGAPGAAPAPTAEAPAAAAPAAPASAAPAEAPASSVKELTILWAQWDPADYLQEVGNLYEAATGIKVNVVQEPWGSFYDRAFAEFAAGGNSFDMIVGDSQWLGQGAEQGHYVEMTDFLVGEGIADTVTESTLTYYGEYPSGSGKYWAFPTEGDADGWAYRMDLFEDADNMAAFKAEYGYDLGVPETWAQLLDIAKFFTRPEEGLYGAAVYTQKDYDAITMGFENVLFSYGGRWQDPETNAVQGFVNSEESIAALEFYAELYQCCSPPGLGNAFFQETNDALINGQAAMIMNYFAFFPALASEAINPHAASTGYFANPAGPGGLRRAALGGQGISIVAYADAERQEAAKDFIRWFAQEDTQREWALFGGYTCNKNVLASQEFLDVAPYNAAFAETMGMVMDYWNIPVFGQLLEITQRELSGFIVGGEGTAADAMNRMAEEHEKILKDTGYLK